MNCWSLVRRNFSSIHTKKSTEPVEFLIASIMFIGGMIFAISHGFTSHYQVYSVMRRYVGQPVAAMINISLSSVILYALLLKRETSFDKSGDKIDRDIDRLYDTYFGNNKIFLRLRRNFIMLVAGWNCCVAIWFFCATPTAPLWVVPMCFFIQSFWIVLRLRRDEKTARREIRDHRDKKRDEQLTQTTESMLSQLSEPTRRSDKRDVTNTNSQSGSLGSGTGDPFDKASGLPGK